MLWFPAKKKKTSKIFLLRVTRHFWVILSIFGYVEFSPPPNSTWAKNDSGKISPYWTTRFLGVAFLLTLDDTLSQFLKIWLSDYRTGQLKCDGAVTLLQVFLAVSMPVFCLRGEIIFVIWISGGQRDKYKVILEILQEAGRIKQEFLSVSCDKTKPQVSCFRFLPVCDKGSYNSVSLQRKSAERTRTAIGHGEAATEKPQEGVKAVVTPEIFAPKPSLDIQETQPPDEQIGEGMQHNGTVLHQVSGFEEGRSPVSNMLVQHSTDPRMNEATATFTLNDDFTQSQVSSIMEDPSHVMGHGGAGAVATTGPTAPPFSVPMVSDVHANAAHPYTTMASQFMPPEPQQFLPPRLALTEPATRTTHFETPVAASLSQVKKRRIEYASFKLRWSKIHMDCVTLTCFNFRPGELWLRVFCLWTPHRKLFVHLRSWTEGRKWRHQPLKLCPSR